jgi:methylthioribose-1-phosphate isomerase
MPLRTVEWRNNKIKIINQIKLPYKLEYRYIRNVKQLWKAIKILEVRGAPALGAAAGLGAYLGIKDSKAKNFTQFNRELKRIVRYIGTSRPTARNLFGGLERIYDTAIKNQDSPIATIKKLILAEAKKIIEEDRAACRKIAHYGSKLIRDKDRILTICNAGILATTDYGTALGLFYRAKEEKKNIKVFACETRPILQGARLTTWELKQNNIDVTLICDNTAAFLMQQGRIDKVIVGADRIASNGDTANKIGTYGLAILAKYHNIPFYIAAPLSTIDLKIKRGKDIPIEERSSEEVTHFLNIKVTPVGVKVFNPAFDVTKHSLITAIITDRGIIKPPYQGNIYAMI